MPSGLIGFPIWTNDRISLGPVHLILRGGAKECQTRHFRRRDEGAPTPLLQLIKQKIDTDGMKAIAVIPARLASTRLPRKMLRQIAGQTLIARVYEGVRSSPLLDDVIVATDSDEIMQVCRQHGWNARMTSATHRSGTERVHEVSNSVAADVYLNVQGDEPLTRAEHIAALLDLMKDPNVQVGTLKTPAPPEDINNPNAVKVVTDAAGRALYFSRATIPFDRDGAGSALFQASRLLRLSQDGARSFLRVARVIIGAQRAAGAVAFPGKRNSHSRRGNSLRYGWR